MEQTIEQEGYPRFKSNTVNHFKEKFGIDLSQLKKLLFQPSAIYRFEVIGSELRVTVTVKLEMATIKIVVPKEYPEQPPRVYVFEIDGPKFESRIKPFLSNENELQADFLKNWSANLQKLRRPLQKPDCIQKFRVLGFKQSYSDEYSCTEYGERVKFDLLEENYLKLNRVCNIVKDIFTTELPLVGANNVVLGQPMTCWNCNFILFNPWEMEVSTNAQKVLNCGNCKFHMAPKAQIIKKENFLYVLLNSQQIKCHKVCNQVIKYSDYLEHQNVCAKRTITCPNEGCDQSFVHDLYEKDHKAICVWLK